MIRCARCGMDTPRCTVDQRHCPQCAREVANIVSLDARRRAPRFSVGKDLTGPRSAA